MLFSEIAVLLLISNNFTCFVQSEETEDVEEVTSEHPTTETEQMHKTTFQIPDQNWVSSVLKDIAYYLRGYKFNEWDRRYLNGTPNSTSIGYYAEFPVPSLRSLHWQVYEHCDSNFYKCITFLHSVIETAPLIRDDDPVTILNDNVIPLNETMIANLDKECKAKLENSEKSGLPFDGPIEKFQWRTSASYYMCWYTMLETPALAMLQEHCDNFANCMDPIYGRQNKDKRAVDQMSFACAMYSFCPDPCCPIKHIDNFTKCYESSINPCYLENAKSETEKKICVYNRKENQNFRDIIANRWNVSCNCDVKGFTWKSKYGMCVDVNECVTGEHNCDNKSEDCLNLPGSFQCICKWGFSYNNEERKCFKENLFKKFILSDVKKHYITFMDKLKRFLRYLGIMK